MAENLGDPRLSKAVTDLGPATRLHNIPRAIGVLDTLKAEGVALSEPAETVRRNLRSWVGWDPLAPVSLEEALQQQGVELETEREEKILRAVDTGLLASLDGRGKPYEAQLRAIVDTLAAEMG